MVNTKTSLRIYFVCASLAVLGTSIGVVSAQAPAGAAAPQPTPAEKAIEYRQAVYKVVAGNFQPLAQIAQGKSDFKSAQVAVTAERLASIAHFIGDAYPEVSREGRTRAKPEIWSNRLEFEQRVRDFQQHAIELSSISARTSVVTDEFKEAVAAVGNDCKGCHEKFRNK